MSLERRFSFRHWEIRYGILTRSTENTADARTVIFVHGTPWSSEVFGPFASALVERGNYNIVLYDLAGYGASQRILPDQDVTTADTSVRFQAELLVELLRRLRKELGVSTLAPDIIAHDIAGTVALRAHLIHGIEFNSLLLLDTNAVLPWGDGFYKLVRSEAETFRKLPPSIYEAMVRAVIRSACHNPKTLESGWEDVLIAPWTSTEHETAKLKQDSFVRQIAQANDGDVREMLDGNMYEQVRCPVKILWGENDKWIPREKMDQLARMLEHCVKGFVVIENAGHLIMIDQPVRVASEIFSWLE